MEDRRDNSVLQAEFDGLKELLTVKLDYIADNIERMDCTLKDHNGRLKLVEKFFEQSKGAGKAMSGTWGIIGGVISAVVVYLITMHI